jgi:hypothetical protein
MYFYIIDGGGECDVRIGDQHAMKTPDPKALVTLLEIESRLRKAGAQENP